MQARDDASLDQLMTAYARGDDRQFDALYEGVSARLESFLRRRGVRDQSRVDDIVQQTFMLIHAARGHFVVAWGPGAPLGVPDCPQRDDSTASARRAASSVRTSPTSRTCTSP